MTQNPQKTPITKRQLDLILDKYCVRYLAGSYRIISSKSESGDGWCMELLDIGGSGMGIVSRQESVLVVLVSNSSMHHRELLKWHC
jgi:hypothetical protein